MLAVLCQCDRESLCWLVLCQCDNHCAGQSYVNVIQDRVVLEEETLDVKMLPLYWPVGKTSFIFILFYRLLL